MRKKNYFSHWQCTSCGRRYQRDEVQYLCPTCSIDYKPGMPLPGVLEAQFDYNGIAQAIAQRGLANLTIREFHNFFSAVEPKYYPQLPVGNTPFYRAHKLRHDAVTEGGIWIKNDSLNPSGSFKDRASWLMVAEAKRLGYSEIVCASTGNAASSLATICASEGIKAVIFVPETAPSAKLVQIQIHGAQLHKVKGTYDDAFKAALEYSAQNVCLNRNTAYHPLTIEGKKSSGLEIFIQNGLKTPDWIVVPVGDGVILAGIHKAFIDLLRCGYIKKLPQFLAVQAESSDAIFRYWQSGSYSDADAPHTIADSISVKTPSNAHWAVRAINESKGSVICLNDQEISASRHELASKLGIFAEPSSALTYFAYQKALAQGIVKDTEQCVLLITGHGLKDTQGLFS